MKPISEERMSWIRDRLKVIEEALRIGQATMYNIQGGGVTRDELQRVVINLSTERAQLQLELRVLSDLVAGAGSGS